MANLMTGFDAFAASPAMPAPVMPAKTEQSPGARGILLQQTLLGWCFQGLTGKSGLTMPLDPPKAWISAQRVESIGIPLSANAWVEPHGQLLADLTPDGCFVYGVRLERDALARQLRRLILTPQFGGKVIDESFSDQDGHHSAQAIDLADGRRIMIDIVDSPTAEGLSQLTAQMTMLPGLRGAAAPD